MGDVVAYYCGGKKPVLELLVSIWSLRKYYDGEIVVCLGHTSVPYLKTLIESGEVTVCIVPGSEDDSHVRHHWRSRWIGMSMVKGDRVLHPDCDTIYAGKLDEAFDTICPKEDWITSWHTVNNGDWFRTWPGHIEEYKKLDPDFDEKTKPFYIEFGLIGWMGSWKYCVETSKACEVLKDDQTAMSYVLMKNGRKAFIPQTKYAILRRTRGYYRLSKEKYDNTVVWHCHPDYYMWWREFLEAREANFMGLGDRLYVKECDRKIYKAMVRKTYPQVDSAPK